MIRQGIRLFALGALAVASVSCGSDTKAPAAAGTDTKAPAAAGGDTTTPPAAAATGTPIVLGTVSSFTGVDIFPESPNAAKAYFDQINAAGGVNGHPIQFLVEDDGDVPEQAAVAAKKLVEENNILAMVGGGSIVDCTTNAKYYAEKGILSLAGVNACGPDAGNVASLNTGPFLGIMMGLAYMAKEQKLTKLCFSSLNIGLTPIFVDVFKPMWEKQMGLTLTMILSEPNEDLTAAVTKGKDCEGVMLGYTEPNYIAYAQIAEAQGLTDGKIKYAMLTSGYSINVAEKLGKAGEGWVVNSEFAPYTDETDTSPDMVEFKALVKAAGLGETSFAQGGYLSAKVMVEALKTVKGDYTRESVGAAIKAVNYATPMLGEPFKWVPYIGGAQANVASKIVQLKGGKFVTVTDWVFWPPR
jgi:branched-chain amino acid transport system substrate-binding protein